MQTTEPYSLSLFWVNGAIVAAQRETKTVIRDDSGKIVFEQPNLAEEIPNDLGEEILGEVNAGLLAQIANLNAARAAEIEQSTVAHTTEIKELKAAHAAEIEQLRVELTAINQPPAPDTSPRALARTALREKWDSLPAWIRGPYQHQFAAANALLDSGQDDAAIALIKYADVPTGFDLEQVEVFSRIRAELLEAIEALPD
jgi:hypothetical protein